MKKEKEEGSTTYNYYLSRLQVKSTCSTSHPTCPHAWSIAMSTSSMRPTSIVSLSQISTCPSQSKLAKCIHQCSYMEPFSNPSLLSYIGHNLVTPPLPLHYEHCEDFPPLIPTHYVKLPYCSASLYIGAFAS